MSVPTMTPLYTNTTPPDAIDNPYVGRALEHTVQGQRPPFGGGAIDLYSVYDRRDILPRRDGTKYRDRVLRLWWEHDYNTIWRSAVSGLIKWYCSIPYEIEANEPVANYFQDLLQYAQFGLGWKALWSRVWKDFFNQDAGGIIEIIATGDPNGPITENDVVVGLAHLDAQRCYLTGNHIYPIIYYSAINGTMHRMHHSRVYRFVDEPSPDERLYGIGDCAFGRGIAIAKRQILMGQYIEASLDDRPPPGINVFSNIDRGQFDKAMAVYNRDQQSDVRPEWGRQVNFFAVDPTQKAEITNLSFSQPPEKFDFISYMNQDVNLLALCLGVDKQELWELTGGGIGTGTQSSVLNQKSQGKAKADLLSMAERFLNIAILPETATFRSKYRDSQQDQQLAALDTQLTTTVTTAKAGGILSTDEGRNFLADRSESFQQVLTDESGKVTAYDDNRIQPVVPSTTTLTDTQNQPGQQPATVPDLPTIPVDNGAVKAYSSTAREFESWFEGQVLSVVRKEAFAPSQRQFAVLLQNELRKSGEQAFLDGKRYGGNREPLDQDDLFDINSWWLDQAGYVDSFASELFTQGLTELEADSRASMWANKSLKAAYDAGVVSTDRSGLYEWVIGPTEEHCDDCQRLNGQVHKRIEWFRRGWQPQSSKLKCSGFNCSCRLVKTTNAAVGRF